jgi:hypothetical protein
MKYIPAENKQTKTVAEICTHKDRLGRSPFRPSLKAKK